MTADPNTPPALALTVADIEDVETVLQIDFGDVNDALQHSTAGGRLRIVAALVWVYTRKTDPSFTFDDARNMPPDELTAAMQPLAARIAGDSSPTSPASSALGSPLPASGTALPSPSAA
jgi:hypothetical protein